MSLSWRLAEIEGAIAYEDVKDSWSHSRSTWLSDLLEHRHDAAKLAELTLRLLDAFTSDCVAFLWPQAKEGYAKIRTTCKRLSAHPSSKAPTQAGELKQVRLEPACRSALESGSPRATSAICGAPDFFPLGGVGVGGAAIGRAQ